jgi:hypothetical protein
VRNIEANPRAAIFRFFVRRLGAEPVTLRIDLDPRERR